MSDPTRIVADADVLAADVLCGGSARTALDYVRAHSWITLVASDSLLEDAEAVVGEFARSDLATDWRERVATERERVDHPPEDHPALASAYRGDAAHLLTFDENLASARTGLSIQPHADLSVRSPDAFVTVFDAAPLYEGTHDGAYPGPDRDPRG